MERRNQILVGILVVQLVLAAIVFWPRAATSGTGGSPLLGELAPEDVAGLAISDASGNSVELTREGDGWVLPEADNFPADTSKVAPLVEMLTKVNTGRLVARTAASQAQLKVAPDEYERLIELRTEEGETQRLYMGTSSGPSATHVRLDGQEEIYLTGEVASWETGASASDWIDTTYVTVPVSETVGLTLENANGTFEFVREGETWTMEGLEEGETFFNEGAFTTLLNQFSALRMTSPLGKSEESSFGMDEPRAVVT
ncbi:MAG: DUF4340 domain-containing protein, partial [Ardenticatenaceae bacterium]